MIVNVDKILAGGEALAHASECSVLLANGIPGDQLKVSSLKKRRGMPRAELQEVLQASKLRVDAPCQHAAQCGGCALQFLSLHEHAPLKSTWVYDAFQKLITPTTQWKPITEPIQFGRRRRMRFWHEKGQLGLRRRASHQHIALNHCLICEPRIETLRQTLQGQLPPQVQSIQICLLSDGIHVILESEQNCPELGIAWPNDVQAWWRKGKATVALSQKVKPLHDKVADLAIRVGPDDFIQNDAIGNQALIKQLQQWCANASFIVDLFSGVGNLSLVLAKQAKVRGAELNIASVCAANANAQRLGLDAKYSVLNLFQSFNFNDFAGADVLILDPPRQGAKEVCKQLGYLIPKKIIMVSCDVASGARDGQSIQAAGYTLTTLKALDLFPYAGHVEALSLWERR